MRLSFHSSDQRPVNQTFPFMRAARSRSLASPLRSRARPFGPVRSVLRVAPVPPALSSGAAARRDRDTTPTLVSVAGLALLLVIGVRVHEAVPIIAKLRPALVGAALGFPLVLASTRTTSFAEVFGRQPIRLTLLYVGLAVLSVPTSLWPGGSFTMLRNVAIGGLLMLVLAVGPATEKGLSRLHSALAVGTGFYGLAMMTTGVRVAENRLTLPYGTLDSNDAAAMMALAMPFSIAGVMSARGVRRLVALATASILAVAILQTGSRGGALAAIVGITVFAAQMRGGKKLAGFVTAVAACGLMWLAAPDSFRTRMQTLATLEQDYNATEYSGRKQIWKRAMTYIARDPVLGVGVGSFSVAEGEELAKQGRVGVWINAHNAYLQAGAELGVGGLLLLPWILVSCIRTAARWRRARFVTLSMTYVASWAAFATSAFFLSHAYSYMLFVLVGMTVCADRSVGLPGVRARQ